VLITKMILRKNNTTTYANITKVSASRRKILKISLKPLNYFTFAPTNWLKSSGATRLQGMPELFWLTMLAHWKTSFCRLVL